MQFSTINETALLKAAEFIVGEETVNDIIELYRVIEQAQLEALNKGHELAAEEALTSIDDAFDDGWDKGFEDGSSEAKASYVQGVADARARPAFADKNVAEILSAQYYDATLVEGWDDEAYDPFSGTF